MVEQTSQIAAKEFGIYIKGLREQRGLSVRQSADRAGIDFGRMARIEGRGLAAPRPETIKGLAHALDVPVTELLAHLGFDLTPPDLRTYLCQRYGSLPDAALDQVCTYVERLVAPSQRHPDPSAHHEGNGTSQQPHSSR